MRLGHTSMNLLSIPIPFDPNIFGGGVVPLSWHGFLSFVGVAAAIYLVVRWARREHIDPDMVYNVAIWGIIGGVIGARVVHVADNWGFYSGNIGSMFQIWSGGIGLWGGILGGWLAGSSYAYIAKYPVGKLMDLIAPAMLIGQSIGRIGDIINGEHWARATDLAWGWYFTHVDSPARIGAQRFHGDPETPVHPAVVYEMIWNMAVLGVLFMLRGKLKPAGSLWMVYLAMYAIGRFGIQWLRLDPVKFWGLQEAHLIAILVLFVAVPFLIIKTRFVSPDGGDKPADTPTRGREQRRRRRAAAR
jgi:phosphatidylglycerol:prolipoprotein diacylglycerol transferase